MAVSNVTAGYLLTHENLVDWPAAAMLVRVVSLALYGRHGAERCVRRREGYREATTTTDSFRRISLEAARTLGWTLLFAGVALAAAVTALRHSPAPAVVGVLLAIMVVLYDGPLKRTAVAPLAMGACRFLNVMLGLSLGTVGFLTWHPMHSCVAAGIGVYVVGVTWFARTEAVAESNRFSLFCSTLVMLAGVALLGYFPQLADGRLPLSMMPLANLTGGWLVGHADAVRLLHNSPGTAGRRDIYAARRQFAVKAIFAIIILTPPSSRPCTRRCRTPWQSSHCCCQCKCWDRTYIRPDDSPMLFGYNTNGLAHHDAYQAVELLADLGYRSVALTIDHGLSNLVRRACRVAHQADAAATPPARMRLVVETGARFSLDSRQKHEPTLVTSEPDGVSAWSFTSIASTPRRISAAIAFRSGRAFCAVAR